MISFKLYTIVSYMLDLVILPYNHAGGFLQQLFFNIPPIQLCEGRAVGWTDINLLAVCLATYVFLLDGIHYFLVGGFNPFEKY